MSTLSSIPKLSGLLPNPDKLNTGLICAARTHSRIGYLYDYFLNDSVILLNIKTEPAHWTVCGRMRTFGRDEGKHASEPPANLLFIQRNSATSPKRHERRHGYLATNNNHEFE